MNEGPKIGPQRVLMALILKYRDKGLKGLKAGGFNGHQRGKRGNKAMRIQFNEFAGIGLCNGAVKGPIGPYIGSQMAQTAHGDVFRF